MSSSIYRRWALPLLVALSATTLWSVVMGDRVIDDAFITLANARTLMHGYGLFLEPGNGAQSASSPLWALLLAPVTLMGCFAPIGAKLLGAAFYVGTLLTVIPIMGQLPDEGTRLLKMPAPVAALVLTAAMAPLAIWSLYGMENGMVAFLINASVLTLAIAWDDSDAVAHRLLPVVPIALLYMSRPEAFGLVAILAIWDLAVALARRAQDRFVQRWLIVAAIVASYHAVDLLTYGTWLPTSASAKLGADLPTRIVRGFRYLLVSSHVFGFVPLLGALVMGVGVLVASLRASGGLSRAVEPVGRAAVVRRLLSDSRSFRLVLLMTLLLAGQVAFVLISGGDWMPFARFASQILPLGACTAVVALSRLQVGDFGAIARRWAAVLTATSVVALILSQSLGLAVWLPRMDALQKSEARALGGLVRRLNPCSGPDTVLAVSDIGRVAWGYRGRVLDWFGLADKAITAAGESQGRIRPETILRRRPDYVVLYANAPQFRRDTVGMGMARYSTAFVTSAAFLTAYVPRFSLQFAPGRWHVVFQRAGERACPSPTY